jgi:hypothetical protein
VLADDVVALELGQLQVDHAEAKIAAVLGEDADQILLRP